MVPLLHTLSTTSDLDELIAEVATGDTAAFAHLYDQVVDRVLRLSHRILRNRSLAEEATQEALVQVWRQAPRFDPRRGSALAWILTIAHRRAVDAVRHEERRATEGLAATPASRGISTHDAADQVCAQQVVGQALESLTALQRRAVELTHIHGLTQSEAAASLEVPLGTLKTRVRDGMLALRRWTEVDVAG